MSAAEQRQTVEWLKERIRKLQAEPRTYLSVLRTGVAPFDALLPARGLPLGQVVELCGEPASGRTTLALRTVAAAHREKRLAAFIDGPSELYPPAAATLGVDLQSLLIVRPGAPGKLVWTAVQLCRSAAFTCVTLDLTHTGVRPSLAESRKLAEAAQQGGVLLVLLTREDAPAEAGLRVRTRALGVDGVEVELVRSRGGALGARAQIGWTELDGEHGSARAPVRTPEDPWGASELPTPPIPRFQRVRASDIRNGRCGIIGQRPGRDAGMPSLKGNLGVH